MRYCFQLLPHANIHYQQALKKLGLAELTILLHALGIPAEPAYEEIGGCAFLSFDASQLSENAFAHLSCHSSLLLLCEQTGNALRPLPRPQTDYLPRDVAEVLKYKGKTNAVFTRMMINCALASGDYFLSDSPVTVLDPLCGRCTTAFCAMQGGMNAIGIDVDRKDLKEAVDYFGRYAQYHRLKHQLTQRAKTCGGFNVPEAVYTFADTREHYGAGDTRTLQLLLSDTGNADKLLRKTPVEVIVTDLPYGVQHAPQIGQKTESFVQLLARALPSWRSCLKPGGTMALSFNTMTLTRKKLTTLLEDTGMAPLTQRPYDDFEHFVEQSVTRDVVIARKA